MTAPEPGLAERAYWAPPADTVARRPVRLAVPAEAFGGLEPRARRGALLSLVIAMHDEEAVLDQLFERLFTALEPVGVELEVVCVDDGSTDRTLSLLIDRSRRDPRVRVISLARNFGKESALTAGLDAARGDMVVPLDADLQDPPELIADFVRLWEVGYDVVYGVRVDRRSDSPLKRATAGLFYRVFNRVADLNIPPDTGDFRLLDRAAVDALKALPERNRFMKGLFAWVGFRQTGIPYARPARAAGSSSWRYWKLFNFALDGVTSFSSLPLRVWTWFGLLIALTSALAAVALTARTLLLGRDVPGYASLMVVVLFGLAAQMVAFGVLGEYVGRLYQEAKQRPVYLVRRRYGFDD